MKRLVAAIPLLLAVVFSWAEEPEGVEGVTYLPRTFYVGDVVEMRLELPDISPGEIVIPAVFPEAEWFLFRRVTVKEANGGSILRIFFSSYQPGIRLMPPLDLGALVLEGIRVDTASLLEREKGGLADTAEPLFLAKTGFYFALTVGLLFGIPLLLILLIRRIRKQVMYALIAARRRRPYQRLARILRDLDQKVLNRNGNLFYTTLTEELKRYISLRSGREFKILTGRETSAALTGIYPEEPFLSPLQGLFRFAEEVKFGGRYPYVDQKRHDLETAETALEEMEEYYHRIWSEETKKEEVSRVDR